MPDIPAGLSVRRAREGDIPEMARIHSQSYPGAQMTLEERLAHFKNHPLAALENHWVCTRNRFPAGIFTLYDFHSIRVGKLVPTGGIGGVAVAPEARRDRIAHWMMVKAVEIMDRNGTPLSLLYPFRNGFYRKLGWGLIGRVKAFRFSPEALPLYVERANVKPVLTAGERDGVTACYKRFAATRNGLLERGDAHWQERVFKNEVCYAFISPDSGEVEGYLTYHYEPYPRETDFLAAVIRVGELVHLNDAALRGLLGFLAAQRDQVKVVELPDQTGLPLEQVLGEPRMPNGRHNWWLGAETAWVGTGLMGRVVQLRRALAAGGFGDGEGRVTLKISDDLNPRNSEPLTVEFSGGEARILSKASADVELTCNSAAFSSIYWGALKLGEALRFGLAEVAGKGDGAFLERVFDISPPVCFDHF